MLIEVESTYFPRITKWHIRRALKWFSQDDLEGLHSVRVIDECPDDPESVRVSAYLRGFLYNGHYSIRTKDQPAEVVLYARDVYFGMPKLFLASPIARLRVAAKLAHEVGHHVIATRGYVYDHSEKYKPWQGVRDPYEEKMADAYAADVTQRMLGHRQYRLGGWLAAMLSARFYRVGLKQYFAGNYQSAACFWSRAYTLNSKNENAGQHFRHAMEKLKTQSPSPLSEVERDWLLHRYTQAPPPG